MTDKKIIIPRGLEMSGNVKVISSKSELHRLIICACLSDGGCRIKYNSELSNDIIATVGCLKTLGAEIIISDGEIEIRKTLDREYIEKNINENTEIFCNESGSTARFILPIISLFCKGGATLTGAGKLPERPFSDLCRCLEKHGAEYSSDKLPIVLKKGINPGGVFEISGNISSQYLSGLLFILPLCPGCRVKLTTPLESAGYVDMTIDAMKSFGVEITEKDGVYTAKGRYTTLSDEISSGGDWSNASFFLCAAGKKGITVEGLKNNSLQPDRKIIEILSGCGYEIKQSENAVHIKRKENIVPFDIDASEIPDSVPVLSVLAASICKTSIIRNISRLKYKESDRVNSVINMINSLGGKAYEGDDCIVIEGKGKLRGGEVDSFNDHRIVMASAVASLICENEVIINGACAHEKSYPDFFKEFFKLTGENR